jgi:hypothetical protein
MSDISLKKLSAKLSAVAGKRNLDSKDLELLREVKEGITGVLQGLKECESCGAAVAEIIRLELGGVRAAVCQACGIKALKSKSLSLKNAKKKEAAHEKVKPEHSAHHEDKHSAPAHKSHDNKPLEKRKPFRTDPHPAHEEKAPVPKAKPAPAEQTALFGDAAPAEKGENVFEDIAREAETKIMTAKKVHQIASGIAFPMNMDRTLSYVRMDAQTQGLHLQPEEIKKIILVLMAKGMVKVKE